ncbi:MAG TPA: PqqD family protein [Bryobacteraceae bacterium]|nr:PqqD family protein [Bryobacteraceae bacterium]
MNPKARSGALVVHQIGNEVIVYDVPSQQMHKLSPAASVVWQHCDGHRSIGDLTSIAQQELGGACNEELVWSCLTQLKKLNLMRETGPRPQGAGRVSRRELIAGLSSGALLFPLSETVFAKDCNGSCTTSGSECVAGSDGCGGTGCACFQISGTSENTSGGVHFCFCQKAPSDPKYAGKGCKGTCGTPTFRVGRKGRVTVDCPQGTCSGAAAGVTCSCRGVYTGQAIYCLCE